MDAWYLVTLTGEPMFWALSVVIVLGVYLLFRKRLGPEKRKLARRIACIYVPGVLLSLALVFFLKNTMNTERPCIPCSQASDACNPYCGVDNSFPSGHTAAVFSVVTSLYLGLRKMRIIPLYIAAALVASSRYFLGVHTAADIVAGLVIGIAVPFIFSLVYRKRFEFR